MSEGMLAAIAGVAAVVVTLAQWFFSLRAASRQRDVEMTQWGQEVIDVMTEIETACFPLSPETTYRPGEIEKLSQRASALVDKGRLFFPNVRDEDDANFLGLRIGWPQTFSRSKSVGDNDEEGTRLEILDHVLKACYVARHLVLGLDGDRKMLRQHIWQSRKRFVRLLQSEVEGSMKRRVRPIGDSVPKDPMVWDAPERRLTLQ